MAYTGDERRQHPRIRSPLKARMWLNENEGGRVIEFEGYGEATDLAIGGLFITSSYLLPAGYPLNVEVLIPNGETIAARGEIAHRLGEGDVPGRGAGMGIRFCEIDAINRERLLRFFVTDQIHDFFTNRFIVEFPHLEATKTLDEIAMIVNLWQDKGARMSALRHPGDTASQHARVTEATSRGGTPGAASKVRRARS